MVQQPWPLLRGRRRTRHRHSRSTSSSARSRSRCCTSGSPVSPDGLDAGGVGRRWARSSDPSRWPWTGWARPPRSPSPRRRRQPRPRRPRLRVQAALGHRPRASTPAWSRAAATCSSTPTRASTPGILELSFGPVSIKAIGILTTKLPGGADGLGPAAAGLRRVHRRPARLRASRSTASAASSACSTASPSRRCSPGLRTGVLDSVLFPRDPVANAPTLIGQLRVVFPIVPRALTVGPALKLGWSTPALVTLSLGLVILQFDDVLGSGPGSASFSRVVLARPAEGAGPAGRRAGHRRPGADPPPGRHRRRVRRAGAGAVGRRRAARLPRRAAADHRLAGGAGALRRRPDLHPRRRRLPSPVHRPATRHPAAGPGRHPAPTTGSSRSASSGTSRSPRTPSRPERRRAWSLPVAVSGWRPTSGSTRCSSSSRRSTSRSSSGSAPSVRYKSISLASLKVRGTISGPGRWEVEGHASISLVVLRRRHRLRGRAGARPRRPRCRVCAVDREDRRGAVRAGVLEAPSCPAGGDPLVTPAHRRRRHRRAGASAGLAGRRAEGGPARHRHRPGRQVRAHRRHPLRHHRRHDRHRRRRDGRRSATSTSPGASSSTSPRRRSSPRRPSSGSARGSAVATDDFGVPASARSSSSRSGRRSTSARTSRRSAASCRRSRW